MKILLDLNGWRKEEQFFGSVLSGRIEVVLHPPIDILVKSKEVEPSHAVWAAFEYRGKNKGNLPIFEYTS